MQRLGCPQLDLVGAGPDLLLILLFHKVEKLMPQQQLGNIQLKTILEQIELKYIREYCSLYGTLEKTAEKLDMNLKTLSRRKKHLEEKYPRSENL